VLNERQLPRATIPKADGPLSANSNQSKQLDQSALRCAIALNVPLGGCQRSMPSKFLNVAKRTTRFRKDARRCRDERAPPGM
jgi:hypothetical protein